MQQVQAIQQILQKVSNPKLVERAFYFAKEAHQGQKRLSGEDYIVHPISAAYTLFEMGLDSSTIAAALLHDVVDDTPRTLEDIEREFGKEIAFLVNGVSKLGQLRLPKKNINIPPADIKLEKPIDPEIENLRKMFFAMAEDLRVILIKLADRLHNMKTLKALPPQRQQRIALETMEIYAPIAERLGMGELKGQLEDLAFPYLYPKEYNWLIENVKEHYEKRKEYLKKIEPIVSQILQEENITVLSIDSRAKHYWSLYKKLLKNDMDIEKIYDLVAMRILVPDVSSCYTVLGIIHKHWKPLPWKINDYIAIPKPNGYRSLHTTCFCIDGKLTEFQIKTPEMHAENEYGICAHWAYKQGINPKTLRRKFAWVSQLREWQKKIHREEEFWEGLKIDFFKDRIFVLTPKGDVIDLPEGSTPVDFAYAVHTDIGNKCAGAKVNGKLVQLSYQLRSGEVVEIITDKNKTPSRDWLEFVKTHTAKARIKEWLKKQSEPENFKRGLRLLNNTFQQLQGINFLDLPENKKKIILEKLNYKNINTIILAVGQGELSPKTVFKAIFPEESWLIPPDQKIQIQPKAKTQNQLTNILLAGQAGLAIYIAKCCLPQPNEQILGYITKHRGAAIHQANCKNLLRAKNKWPQKIIEAQWQEIKSNSPYKISFKVITSEDRVGLLRDITSVISSVNGNILTCHTILSKSKKAPDIFIKVEIASAKDLETIFTKLYEVKGIQEIKRV